MELKKVNQEIARNYAKKNEISKKEIKMYTPEKWIVDSSTGLVTLLYTNARNSIHKIGVVIGCMTLNEPTVPVYQKLIYLFFDFASWILGITFIFMFFRHIFKSQKYDEDTRLKSVKRIKVIGIFLAIFVVITFSLSTFWKVKLTPFVEAIDTSEYKNILNIVEAKPMC